MKKIITLLSSAVLAISAWAQNTHNGHEYVDLGLTSGTLWATCNVGAETPDQYGDFYAWGEVETYYSAGGNTQNPTWKEGYSAGYDWSTYKYMDHSKDSWEGFTKYTFADGQTEGIWYDSEGQFIGDNKTELEDADDVAVQTWGGSWKMPTYEQQTELRDECYWVWTDTYNGVSVNGYIVYKAKKDEDKGVKVYDGNTPSSDYDVATDAHIFLPAAGSRWGTVLYDVGNRGYYWSRSLDADYSDIARYLYFHSDFVGWNDNNRSSGFSVRPVYDPAPIAQITIGEETTKYYDVDEFLEAFYAIGGTATVKLLGDITLPENGWFYNDISTADITLDLNGHNIIGNVDVSGVIEGEFNCTITGNGVVENNSQDGSAFGAYGGSLVVNEGTYISMLYVCYVTSEATIVINGGKFKAPNLYYDDGSYNKPIVKGGLFSMDPTDCVAEGYEVVANDDEETKAEYPYKVVEKSSTPTAIESVNADKAGKTIKTIENGKVVIIRNGEKFDLAGRKL